MQPGDYARLEVLSAPSDDARAARRTTEIAGKIVAIGPSEVVLADGIRMEPVEQAVPRGPLARVPGVNRLVTSTGIVITPRPMSGEVRVPRSSIASASPIPAEAWEQYNQPHEVAGLSSPFNAPK